MAFLLLPVISSRTSKAGKEVSVLEADGLAVTYFQKFQNLYAR